MGLSEIEIVVGVVAVAKGEETRDEGEEAEG